MNCLLLKSKQIWELSEKRGLNRYIGVIGCADSEYINTNITWQIFLCYNVSSLNSNFRLKFLFLPVSLSVPYYIEIEVFVRRKVHNNSRNRFSNTCYFWNKFSCCVKHSHSVLILIVFLTFICSSLFLLQEMVRINRFRLY